jgi:hypothetical protein
MAKRQQTKKTPSSKKVPLTDKERAALVRRLRAQLNSGRFTMSEIASIRGRIGGLLGAGNPGRRLGGIRAAEARWGKKGVAKKSKKISSA